VRFLAFGARPKRVDAPVSGEVIVPIAVSMGNAFIPFREVPGRKWLVIPTTLREYTLLVGDEPVTVKVPADFDFEWAVRDALFPELASSGMPGRIDLARLAERSGAAATRGGFRLLRTGKQVKEGDRVLAFDIITGDQLFVDRVSYHFFRPKVGQGFVFRTDHIKSEYMVDARTGGQLEQYYIKRLVGVPGDKLQVRAPVLYRNGDPISGASAFEANAHTQGKYRGYFNTGLLAEGKTVTVPAQRFFAMGDNSGNSQDSRYWGYVPAKDVVGRPLFVYYPFTRHWGPAR
jgi:signal peptidase I